MSENNLFDDPESSTDEENQIVDEDTISSFDIENSFPVKYKIADESAVSLKKVYILNLAADKSFRKIAAGLSNNHVHLFDINDNRSLMHSYVDNLKLKAGTVCGLCFLDEAGNSLLVGITNGDVSLYDLRSGKLEHTFRDPYEQSKRPISSFDVNSNGRFICVGTERVANEVYLMFFDVRMRSAMGAYGESHQEDVTNVKFHPTNPDLLCTGSIDGLINIFDISEPSEDDALTFTINTENSVHKLKWHKNLYNKDIISCITDSNDFQTYDAQECDVIAKFSRAQITESIKRKSAMDCNVVSCHSLPDGGLILLATSNFNNGEVLRSVQVQTKELIPRSDFCGNKQIVRESIYDPKSSLLVTAGESGIVTLWSPSATADHSISDSSKLKAKSLSSKIGRGKNPY